MYIDSSHGGKLFHGKVANMFVLVNELKYDKTNKKWPVHPTKTQFSLGFCLFWFASSLCDIWVNKDPRLLHADSEDWSVRPVWSESSLGTQVILLVLSCCCTNILLTVMILSFRTDRPGQTVQTQIRLLLEEEQSDLDLHCLPFRLHYLDSLVYGKAT